MNDLPSISISCFENTVGGNQVVYFLGSSHGLRNEISSNKDGNRHFLPNNENLVHRWAGSLALLEVVTDVRTSIFSQRAWAEILVRTSIHSRERHANCSQSWGSSSAYRAKLETVSSNSSCLKPISCARCSASGPTISTV